MAISYCLTGTTENIKMYFFILLAAVSTRCLGHGYVFAVDLVLTTQHRAEIPAQMHG